MSKTRTYLDHNASAPLRPVAREAITDALARFGNASSVHGEGRDLRRLVESARGKVAALVGGEADNVIFTASATEAACLALSPEISSDGISRPASHLYIAETEHPCVLAGGRFPASAVTMIPVRNDGIVDLTALDALLDQHDESAGAPYVAVQLTNSETGIIQPVAEIAQKVRFRGGYTLCDAVQAAGRLPINITELGVDFVLLSAHKIGGPQGAGALIKAHSILDLPPVLVGGGQEKNQRAGTENVAAIAGFGAAAEEAMGQLGKMNEIAALRDSLEAQLHPICAKSGLADRLVIFGGSVDRVGNTTLFSVDGLKAETALIAFDLDGVAVSSGSACSSGKVGNSHVLAAMGVNDNVARGAVRVSFGWSSSRADVDNFTAAFGRITRRLAEMQDEKISGAA